MTAADWRDAAACRGMAPADGATEPHPWFSDDAAVRAEALAVCGRCPVRAECAEAGVGEMGVWGGEARTQEAWRRLSGQERARARRRGEVHRLGSLGWPADLIARQVGFDAPRQVYRILGQRCSVDGCWCAARTEVGA